MNNRNKQECRTGAWISRLPFYLFVLLMSGTLLSGENLLGNWSFEKDAWRGGAWSGDGAVRISRESAYHGGGCLQLSGNGMNARVQAYSEKIDVEPGTSYTFECAYRLLKGRGNVAVRWGQAGVVFSIKGGNSQWLKLSEGIKSRGVYVALYAQKLGAAEHEKLSGNEFEVPDGVTEVTVYVQAIGDSTIEVDAVELSKTK